MKMLNIGLILVQTRYILHTQFPFRTLDILQVIVTSYLFPDAKFSLDRLRKLVSAIGKEKLVIDLR